LHFTRLNFNMVWRSLLLNLIGATLMIKERQCPFVSALLTLSTAASILCAYRPK